MSILNLITNVSKNLYCNKLNEALMKEPKIVIFAPYTKWEDINKFVKRLQCPEFYVCVPDNFMMNIKASFEGQLLKLSQLQEFNEKYKVTVFTGQDALSLKFWDYFSEIGIENVLLIGRTKDYNRICRSMLFNITKINSVYNTLDITSQEYYAATLCSKGSGDIKDIIFSEEKQYFLEGYLPEAGNIVIDGGAYDGMTAKAFRDIGCHVYSFEMDCLNYQKGLQLAQKEKFVLENMGLGRRKSELQYRVGGVGSAISKDGDKIAQIIDIDTYANEKGLPQIDFIKMDIEGSEMSALQGAAHSIRKYKPKMAICTYHKLQDMWEIPLYIKKLRPDYEFTFRHHIIDGGQEYLWNKEELQLLDEYTMDYKCKSMWESVLYCR